MQQSSIAPMNTPQPRRRDANLQTTQDSTLRILLERFRMVGQVRLSLSQCVSSKKKKI